MTHKLAARYVVAKARLADEAHRKAEAGMATAEWALVTLCVCAFAVVALTFLNSKGADLIGKILTKAFNGGK